MRAVRSLVNGFSIPCFLLGLLFFAASLTPSLIPRGPVVQGVLGGIVIAVGYFLGRVIELIWAAADLPPLKGKLSLAFRIVMSGAVLAFAGWTMTSSLQWQNELRLKMGMEVTDALHLVKIVGIATATFAAAFLAGALIAAFFRWVRSKFYRVMPERRANIFGALTVALILIVVTRDGVFDRVIKSLDESYEAAQELFETAPPLPTNPNQTGSTASLVDWGGMGQPGRDFVQSGPDAEAISSFSGKPALDPIRVYVGRANGETPRERAQLALAELKRLNAFDREILIVTSPTGTGWMDPGSHDTVEYIHNGDIATVSVQYSYLQSPLALILETSTGLNQATALLEAVHEHWKTLPKDSRPRLYAHGLSLGAWSSMHATNLFRLLNDPINGAFWAGPPFPSNLWQRIQNKRAPDSPWVLPTIGNGSLVRYASHFADASQAKKDWGTMRIVFLQYSSDPIVFYDPHSIWRAPPWMNDPPAEDVSRHLIFIPFVTQFQLALDMALSFGAPPGHGHAYFAQDYIAPWVQATDPEGWTAEDTARLKLRCDGVVKAGCDNDAR